MKTPMSILISLHFENSAARDFRDGFRSVWSDTDRWDDKRPLEGFGSSGPGTGRMHASAAVTDQKFIGSPHGWVSFGWVHWTRFATTRPSALRPPVLIGSVVRKVIRFMPSCVDSHSRYQYTYSYKKIAIKKAA
jgi:hypothetical protein